MSQSYPITKTKYVYIILFGSLFILILYMFTKFQIKIPKPLSTVGSMSQNESFVQSKALVSNSEGLIATMDINNTYVQPKTIVMWWGQNIPSGWIECDGSNGTPDLRGRFPLAYNDSQNSTANTLGKTGGESQVRLSLTQIPKHSHTGTTNEGGWGTGTGGCSSGVTSRANNTGTHSHTFITNITGNDTAHENRPPYLALKFIMKL